MMTTSTIIGFTLLYLFCGTVLFFGVWKSKEGLENEIGGFYDQSRSVRIMVRLLVLVLWPVVFLLLLIGMACRILQNVYTAFTE